MTDKTRWSRVLYEGPVIVASILLAFAIDAWWDQRQQRLEEQRLLRNLHAELSETSADLSPVLDGHRRVRDRAIALAEFGMSGGSHPLPVFDSPVQLPNLFTGVTTFHPKTGVLQGALATGRLDLIMDDRLRFILAGWPQTLAEFEEQQSYLWDLAREARPVLLESVPIAERVLSAEVLTRPTRAAPDAEVSVEFQDFLMSTTGQNLTSLRAQFEGFYVRDGEVLLEAINELLGLIEAELQ